MPRRTWLALLVVVAMTVPLAAQRWSGMPRKMVQYDGRFTIARIPYNGYPGWSFDWPEMEHNLGQILRSITAIPTMPDSNNIIPADDPELFKNPIAYISEPGYWFPTESEVIALRAYLEKGGFLIVDDFHYDREWIVFDRAIHQVLPGAEIKRLTIQHPIFNSFFQIKSLRVPYPGQLGEMGLMGEFYGIHQDNDPTKRLKVVISYNMDLGDYMEWSATGVYAVAPTNEAYKFFINYLIYGLSH